MKLAQILEGFCHECVITRGVRREAVAEIHLAMPGGIGYMRMVLCQRHYEYILDMHLSGEDVGRRNR